MTRADQNIRWIQQYCVTPDGAPVCLTKVQMETLRLLYDRGERLPVRGRLAAYLALLHTAGIEAPLCTEPPQLTTDIFTVWSAAGPELRRVLKREGAAVVCPTLGTRFAA